MSMFINNSTHQIVNWWCCHYQLYHEYWYECRKRIYLIHQEIERVSEENRFALDVR